MSFADYYNGMDRRHGRHYQALAQAQSWGNTEVNLTLTDYLSQRSMSTGMFRGRVQLINRESKYPFYPVCLECHSEVLFNAAEFVYWCPWCKQECEF